MNEFEEYLNSLDDQDLSIKMEEVLDEVSKRNPELKREVKWNQPMFSDHGTYIMGFSADKL